MGRASFVAAALGALLVLPAAAQAARPITLGLALSERLTPVMLPRVQATGATTVSLVADWSMIAPATRPEAFDPADPDDPAYQWGSLDGEIETATGAGLAPIVTVIGAPAWATKIEGIKGQGPWSPDVAQLGLFFTAIAKRYDGAHGQPRVRYWSVWNEPNLTKFLQPQYERSSLRSPDWYRSALNAAAAALHAARRDNVVIAGNLAPFTDPVDPSLSVPPMVFMREVLCMSPSSRLKPACRKGASFDVWAVHPYTSGNALHRATKPDDVSLGNLPDVARLLRSAVAAKHVRSARAPQLWVTEFSWDTSPPDPQAVPIALQSRWTSEAIYRMWRNGVSRMLWFSLRDEPFGRSPYQSGLYFANWKPKPTLRAYRFPFVAYLERAGVTIWGRTPRGTPAAVRIERRALGGKWRTIAAFRSGAGGVFTRTLPLAATRTDRLRAVTADDSSLAFSLTQPPDRFISPFGSR